jgi:phosphatidylinositol kinase/protein kinase (PI-3  family)
MIDVIDNLLKKINVDLQFTAYKVLACSNDDGVLEFISGAKTV